MEEEEKVEEGEAKQGDREKTTKGAGEGQMKDNGDLSSPVHCSLPLCE